MAAQAKKICGAFSKSTLRPQATESLLKSSAIFNHSAMQRTQLLHV